MRIARLLPPAPLLMPVLCLASGIAVGRVMPFPWLLAALAVLLVTTWLTGHWPRLQSVGIWLCFVVLGMTVAPGEEQQVADGVWTEAVVATASSDRPKTVMVELLLPSTGERRRCFLTKPWPTQAIGSNLLVRIHDGCFIGRDDWQPGGDGFNHLSRLQRLRLRALLWRQHVADRLLAGDDANHEALAVLSAMALGDKSALTKELRDTYAVSGASHILALSGLHLGIIYMLLTFLTMGRRRSWLVQVLLVLAMWTFALLTGLSTSILRAAIMITVYSLFALGGRRHASLGVLSFTALIMLLADSRSLFDVGFQLSFMSMLGILLFVPLMERFTSVKWMMSHPVARWLFGLMAVSLAAQLCTAPIVAYYFGRFPTWFLLTNLLVVPMATVILFGTLLTLAVPLFAGVLLWLVGCMNTMLTWVASLPLASIEGLHPSLLQVAMIYVVIAVAYVMVHLACGPGRRH